MARLSLLLVIVFFAFTVYAFVNCLITRDENVRGLPKVLWAILIVLLSPFGGILWFVLGRERESRPRPAAPPRTVRRAPDDDPDFLERLGRDKERDARIAELEARLAELDDDQNKPTDK